MNHWLLILAAVPALALADTAGITQDVTAVKQTVLELNRSLYQLEEELISPATTQIALYVSLRSTAGFEPLAIDVQAGQLPPVHHIYTERQIQALRMGAVQPLASSGIGPGHHRVQVTVRGVDSAGREQQLTLEEMVEKTASPLLLEVVIADDAAGLQLRTW